MLTLKRFSCLICVVLLSGCSFTFVYNHIDWWVNWYVDDYVDLNKSQQRAFDQVIESNLRWHRQTQLPKYSADLAAFRENVEQGISLEQLTRHNQQLREHWRVLLAHLAPQLEPIAFSLTSKQRKQLVDAIAKQNQEFREDREELTKDEWYNERYDDYYDGFKEWFGPLTKTQKQSLRDKVTGLTSTFSYWIDFRDLWLVKFDSLLSNETERQLFTSVFLDLVVHGREYRKDEHKQLAQNNNAVYLSMLHYQLNSLTEKQKKKFFRKLERYLDDFKELSEE
ncbi:DUF6279 family lipoprotein [Thalassotalea fusca]